MKVTHVKDVPLDEREFTEWIAALYSGKYKQDRKTLQDAHSGGYCCLGLACKKLIPKSLLEVRKDVLHGTEPDDQEEAPEWLKQISSDFMDRIYVPKKRDISIITMNDDMRMSFPEIATVLELVYVHGIMDESIEAEGL